MSKTFYVTTPIYYVTAKPHLGSLYSTVLADIAARWHRLQGYDTCLVTGTDEHGQKVAAAAAAAGKQPQVFIDEFIPAFRDTWKRYGIDVHHFIRTTDTAHKHAVTTWIQQLQRQGDIYQGQYAGFYCTPCETFVTEKDHESSDGSAPKCGSCGRATSWMEERCYFFRLSAYQERLLAWYRENPQWIVPGERIQEVISFVEGGLKDLAISRSKATVPWGIPFPGDESQVVYVWADALNNYLSAVGYGDPNQAAEFARWWPAQLQVLGKDIVRFHAVYWPAFLMAAGLALPERLLVHGWIKVGGEKMSKSLGNVIDPNNLADAYGVDPVRYVLAKAISVSHDSSFSIEDLEQRINADLADDLGNLVQRVVSFAVARKMTALHVPDVFPAEEMLLLADVEALCQAASEEYDAYMYHRALAEIWKGIARVNAYVHAQEPWKLRGAEHDERVRMIVVTAVHAMAHLARYIIPVMPERMAILSQRLGVNSESLGFARVYALQAGAPLFPKIEQKKAEEPMNPAETKSTQQADASCITIDTFAQSDLRVGTITAVDIVPKSEKLYKLTVDAGELGVRTICSGVRAHFAPEDLLGKQGVFVANLAPRAMMGIPSQGMMLFVEDAIGRLQLVSPAASVPNGGRLR